MTTRLTITISAIACLAIPTGVSAESLLDLGEGHFLRGEPVSIDPATVVWKHQLSGAELRYPVAGVHRIAFSGESAPSPTGDILLLDNGDVLTGSLESLDKDNAVIHSANAGSLTIPRSRMRTARLSPGVPTLSYEDSGDLVGWKANSSNERPLRWTAKDGVLEFAAKGPETIARTVKMPKSADISFETTWSPRSSRLGMSGAVFSVLLCADHDRPGEVMTSGYSLNFNRSWLTIQRVGDNNDNERDATLGRVQLSRHLDGGNSLKVRVVLNRAARRLHIFLNGREAGDFQDDAGKIPDGSAIHLVGDGDTPIRLRRLRVEAWNGLLGSKLASTSKSGQEKDLVLTIDGDEMFGEILAIRQDAKQGRIVDLVIPVSKSKPMSVPVHSIGHISFARGPESPPAAEEAIVRLDDGSRLTGKLQGFDGKNLTLAYLGKDAVDLPATHLLAIDFPSGLANPAEAGEKPADEQGLDFLEE